MKGFRGPAQRVRETLCADRHDHEFLEVDVAVGMRAAVEDVQHGCGQDASIDAAQIAVKRNLKCLRNGAGGSHRNREDGIGAQLAFVGSAVERDHGLIDQALVGCVHAFELGSNHGFDIGHGLQDTLAEEMALVAVAQLHGLMLAGGGARRHNGAAQSTAFKNHICFDGRISARIKNFARANRNNLSHIIPRNTVLQPVVQFGTAIHGNGFSGSALNCFQKLMHVLIPLSVQRKNSIVVPFGF